MISKFTLLATSFLQNKYPALTARVQSVSVALLVCMNPLNRNCFKKARAVFWYKTIVMLSYLC